MAGPQASTEARPTILPEQVLQLSYSTPSTFKNHSEWPVPMMRRPPLFIHRPLLHLVVHPRTSCSFPSSYHISHTHTSHASHTRSSVLTQSRHEAAPGHGSHGIFDNQSPELPALLPEPELLGLSRWTLSSAVVETPEHGLTSIR
jgi:hypothetical protein